MRNFLDNYKYNEILYFINLIDKEMVNLEIKYNSLKDLKDEFTTFLSNNKED